MSYKIKTKAGFGSVILSNVTITESDGYLASVDILTDEDKSLLTTHTKNGDVILHDSDLGVDLNPGNAFKVISYYIGNMDMNDYKKKVGEALLLREKVRNLQEEDPTYLAEFVKYSTNRNKKGQELINATMSVLKRKMLTGVEKQSDVKRVNTLTKNAVYDLNAEQFVSAFWYMEELMNSDLSGENPEVIAMLSNMGDSVFNLASTQHPDLNLVKTW